MTFGLGVALGWILGILSGLWVIHGMRQDLLNALAKLRAAEADVHDVPRGWVQVDGTAEAGIPAGARVENCVCVDGVYHVRGVGPPGGV